MADAWLAGRNPRTLAAYRRDLEDFRLFLVRRGLAAADGDAAAQLLFCRGLGPANGLALAYRADMTTRQLSAATVNRRLSALRSLTALAATLGLITWRLCVENVARQAYRDTAGPGRDAYRDMLAAAAAQGGAPGARDVAILRLLHDLALRRGEVVSLDGRHVDLRRSRLMALGKGRTAREALSLPGPTLAALTAWLDHRRGGLDDPLFHRLDRGGTAGRLTAEAVYKLVKRLGGAAGVVARPHGLRHTAITEALERTKGDIRRVQRFARHRSIQTTTIYDDNRSDMAGAVAALIADE